MKESAENYLETIYVLSKKNKSVKSIDIANVLEFSKPSVSIAMKKLREKKLITVEGNGNIVLTEDGLKFAQSVFERHTVIAKVLIKIGVPEDIAREDACKIEHVISAQTLSALKKQLDKD